MAKKMKRFDSFSAYENWADSVDGLVDAGLHIPVLIDDGWKLCADMEIVCAKPETALRRFFRAFSEVPELAEWKEPLMEYLENGTYNQGYDEIGDDGKHHMWAFTVENTDGENSWYVSVTLSGVYTGRFD